jgi:hypothetical protein
MPRSAQHGKLRATVYLPFEVYREAAIRAERRGWSLSQYLTWCAAQQVRRDAQTGRLVSAEVQALLEREIPS